MSDNQQRILGYFIEEAKEHLATIEQGLEDLQQTSQDSEKVHELFRAAHSVKGGGAMLGYNSIQKTAHRLEDAFKVFRDGNVQVDEELKSLFFEAFDLLQDLITRLESPEGLTEAQGKELVEQAAPKFKQLQSHLNKCADITPVIADLGEAGGDGKQAEPQKSSSSEASSSRETASETSESDSKESPLTQLRPLLREMLDYFKGEESDNSRQTLQEICDRAKKVAKDEQNWQTLLDQAKSAIGNPKHSYETLAPIIIKEIKQGADYLELGKSEKITASDALKHLAEASTPQVLMPTDPQAAAELLKRVFNQQQLSQLKEKIGV